MKKILMVIPYISLPGEHGYNRFRFIAEKLSERGHEVHLLTSCFNHVLKKNRTIDSIKGLPYKVHLISEPGYKKNVGLMRIISHFVLNQNMESFIKSQNIKFEVLYCAYPTMSICNTVGKWAKKRKLPFFIDVQDIWPESIKTVLNLPDFFWSIILFPLTLWANQIYSRADYIIAVSQTYLERALKCNKKYKKAVLVYIGSDLSLFKINHSLIKRNDEFWAIYIGTISHSYDIKTVILAAKSIQDSSNDKIKFQLLGIGPQLNEMKTLSEKLDCKNVNFVGYLPYEQMIEYLLNSDVALNALKGNSQQSITNKLSDYLSAGLFILNSSPNKEIVDLINNYNLGTNYLAGDYMTLCNKLIDIFNNRQILKESGQRALTFSEKYMDRNLSYNKIFELIEN
jgi:glycosyltransferase involved in cell wall biosynthesis